ncbi:hypothetical protein AABB24_009740, partial [Solanum stoloniferum]
SNNNTAATQLTAAAHATPRRPIRGFFSFTSQNRRKAVIVFIDGTAGADLQLRPAAAACQAIHPLLSCGFWGISVEILCKQQLSHPWRKNLKSVIELEFRFYPFPPIPFL